MSKPNENLTLALAILSTEVGEDDVHFNAGAVTVRGQRFYYQDDDAREVLQILMADKEFGFAVTKLEMLADDLRTMQKVWTTAAESLKLEAVA